MKKVNQPVEVAVEKWTIPSYPFPDAEEMPMFAETCNHQGTTGNPYPNRVVSQADAEHRADREWTVIRLENEYKVDIIMETLPYEYIRWIENPDEVDVEHLEGTTDMKKVVDMKGNPLLLFVHEWSVGMTLERNKSLRLSEFGGWDEDAEEE